ncbi:unnamed protein product [Phytophthora fragariaefolia]|uniref:Unnamed protein product n=1 Tax=Phytophthora fragariaefolia TaxID=1490495 RepID=A0A9W6X7E8_9STRA|nr:unnamed protein product [Phytophthora fragariaefolia]
MRNDTGESDNGDQGEDQYDDHDDTRDNDKQGSDDNKKDDAGASSMSKRPSKIKIFKPTPLSVLSVLFPSHSSRNTDPLPHDAATPSAGRHLHISIDIGQPRATTELGVFLSATSKPVTKPPYSGINKSLGCQKVSSLVAKARYSTSLLVSRSNDLQ